MANVAPSWSIHAPLVPLLVCDDYVYQDISVFPADIAKRPSLWIYQLTLTVFHRTSRATRACLTSRAELQYAHVITAFANFDMILFSSASLNLQIRKIKDVCAIRYY